MGLTQISLTGACDTRNDIWCMDNAISTAGLVGASAVPGLGPERLRDPRIGVVWRTPAGGGDLTITFNPPVSLEVFSIHGLNPVTTPLELDIGTAPGLSDIRSGPWAPVIDPDVGQGLWINARDLAADPAPVVAEIVLRLGASADLGRIWAGNWHWTPCFGHHYAAAQGFMDLSTIQRSTRSGAVFADAAVVQRTHEVEYNMIEPDEWDGPVFQLSRVAGTARQLLFIPDYDVYPPERHAILGYQESVNPITALGFQRFQKSFVMRESG